MSSPDDKSFWDKTWQDTLDAGPESMNAPTWRNDMELRRLDFLRGHLPQGGWVVEVGCGSGRLLARVGRESGARLIGLDYSITALDLLGATNNRFGVHILPVGGDAFRLPLPTQSVDLIMSGGLLEHFENPQPVIAEMVRVLKPDGAFYAGVVPRRFFSLHRPMHRWLGPKVYRSRFTPEQYRAWLAEAGCTGITSQNCGVYLPLMQHLPPAPRRPLERTLRQLDGSSIADVVGYYILLLARKGSA